MVSSRLVNFFFKYASDLLIQFRVWYCLTRHPPENFFIICLEPPKTFCSQMRERGQLTGSVTRRNSLFLFLVPQNITFSRAERIMFCAWWSLFHVWSRSIGLLFKEVGFPWCSGGPRSQIANQLAKNDFIKRKKNIGRRRGELKVY